MRRQTALGVVTGVALLSIAAAASASPTGGGDGSPASQAVAAQFGGTFLNLSPQAAYDSAVVRVAGPGGYSLEKRFAGGEAIAVDLAAEGQVARRGRNAPAIAAAGLADGRYQYEAVLRSGGTRRVQSGVFFVEAGAAISRGAKRSQLAAVSNDLRSGGAGAKSPRANGESIRPSGLQGPGQEITNADDAVQVLDTAGDDRTRIAMQSEFTGGYPDWSIDNNLGNLQFISFNYAYSPYTETPRMTVTGYGGGVGIGTTAPTNRLHVYAAGGFNQRIDTGYGGYHVLDQYLTFPGYGGERTLMLHSYYSYGQVRFNDDAPNNSLVVDNAGIGVGTLYPEADFHLANQSATGDTVFKLVSATGNWNIGVRDANGVFTFNKVGTPQEFSVREANHAIATLDVAGHVRGTSFKSTSSRDLKTGFVALDPTEVLAKVVELPVTSWRYKTEEEGTRHFGPVAEDFQRLFGLGDGRSVSSVDADGVALAAIQGLNSRLQAEIEILTERLEALEKKLDTSLP